MDATGIRIRPYEPEDAAAVVALARELQAHESTVFDRMRPAHEYGPWYLEHLLKQCAELRGTLLIALSDGRPVGYATILSAVDNTDDLHEEIAYRYALVGDLAVTQSMRGRGVGRKLLAECESIARSAGARWMRIGVLAGNARALKVYRDFGFADHHVSLEKPLRESAGPTA